LSARDLKGARVLLVEDQMIVAMEIEVMLRAAGCEIVGPVGTLQAAMALAHEEALDLAVPDVTSTAIKSIGRPTNFRDEASRSLSRPATANQRCPRSGAISLA
jgi:DNA-binding NarL/FixJ family response regulator